MADASKDGRLHAADGLQTVASGTKHESADGSTHTIILRTEQASLGIVQSEELIGFANDVTAYLKKSLADGKFSIDELFAAITLAPSAWAGFSGSSEIPAEFRSATGEEKDKLLSDLYAAVMNFAGVFVNLYQLKRK